MDTQPHKMLHYLEHLWPIFTGLLLAFMVTLRFLWFKMTQNFVTKDELHSCREDVREEDRAILNEIKESNRLNQEQHENIMNQIIRLHK